jgi:hypothetical protein
MCQTVVDILKAPLIWGAVIALTGVIFGQLSTFVTGRWADQRRWKREDATRYLADRRVAYAAFLTEITKAAHLVPSAANGPALETAWSAFAALELVGGQATVTSAQALLRHTEQAVQVKPTQTFDAVWSKKREDCLKSMQDDLKAS